jgi:hypothetical protein
MIDIKKKFLNDITNKYNRLPFKKELTTEQIFEIKRYFYDLTKQNIPTIWHQFCYSRNGIYSEKYIPKTLANEIYKKVNKLAFRNAYADKNMLDIVLPSSKHPKTILKCINGYYYFYNTAVSYNEAIKLCNNLGVVLIKPSLASYGKGVRILDLKDGIDIVNGEFLTDILRLYGKNFCIQEVLEQHESMKNLNPSSVNTIRFLTYRSGMEILVLYAAIRIGRKYGIIDNETSGGMSAKINVNDGKIAKYAIGRIEEGLLESTDSGTLLDGYEIPSFKEAYDLVMKQHLSLPCFNIIGWDVAINTEGEPTIIEFNVHPDLSQSACGPAFGEYTDRILKEIFQNG